MGNEAPDPKTFASWEEAFQFPIPAVRGMEKQLRRDIDSNREKLRTLVGASYRDLLGTAESIISMDSQMHDVEGYMGELGKRCNTRILEKKWSNFRSWNEEVAAPNSARYTFASHLAVLRSCPDVISRLLKTEKSVLLAAKVLVISRLLHTKLSQRADPPPYLETLRNKLGTLRRRLLSSIDRRFKRLDIARDVLVEAMCAFALATSSSAKDILRHYLHIRQEAISERMAEDSTGRESILLALRLHLTTLRDAQAVIPGELPHALEKLTLTPLFKSQEVSSLMGLDLDVHERWIASDIKTFIPYIRHDDLTKSEAERTLQRWAKESFASFRSGLRTRIENVQDPQVLMQLRGQVLELWLSNHQHSSSIGDSDNLHGLRTAFTLQAISNLRSRVSLLDGVSTIVHEILQNWQPGVSDLTPSLWASSMTSMEVSNGGRVFRENLAARSLGINGPLLRLTKEYTKVLASIEVVENTIKYMRETRWTDEMDDVDDSDDLLDNKQVLLSEDDPQLLQEELNTALDKSYAKLQASLDDMQSHLQDDDSSRCSKACFLIRAWRELRQRLPKSYQDPQLGLTCIPNLHRLIASTTLDLPVQRCSKRLQKVAKSVGGLASKPLWEGDPELPVLPSPWTYRFLLDLMSSMTEYGSDIWSPQATDALKREVIVKVAHLLEESLNHEALKVNGHIVEESNAVGDQIMDAEATRTDEEEGAEKNRDGEEEKEAKETSPEDASKDVPADIPTTVNGSTSDNDTHPRKPTVSQSDDFKIQAFFDTAYLINATIIQNAAAADNKLQNLSDKLADDQVLGARSVERVKKDAAEYWKRTSLLFGLLA